MTNQIMIRETTSKDIEQVLALYPLVFTEEDLRPVVSSLLEDKSQVLSLAGFEHDALVGHVLFTICGVDERQKTGALLGPVGVMPAVQRQGLGGSLIQKGLEMLLRRGIGQVFVLGDPAYYQRFGFAPERRVLPPYPLPEQWADAWQSTVLSGHAPLEAGRLSLPESWMDPALWGP